MSKKKRTIGSLPDCVKNMGVPVGHIWIPLVSERRFVPRGEGDDQYTVTQFVTRSVCCVRCHAVEKLPKP